MEQSPSPSVVVPRDAATVAVVRDSADKSGIEVLLLRRTNRATFVAGAHVFPGGAVDESDAALDELLSHSQTHAPAGFATAAVRECFEEAGLLFAHHRQGRTPNADERTMWRGELARGELSFGALLEREQLLMDTASFRSWSRWVTPVGSPKRFDTRFFVAISPIDQQASPDDTEITQCQWFRPRDALDAADRNEMLLITPTRATLHGLRDFRSTHEVTIAVSNSQRLG